MCLTEYNEEETMEMFRREGREELKGFRMKMKLLVINASIRDKHRKMIEETAKKTGAELCFVSSEDEAPQDFAEPDIIYGFGMKTAAKSRKLKWLCVPSAGVDFLMKEDAFANKDCLLTNSAGAYGVSIAEHIIAVSIMMMRHITEHVLLSKSGKWGTPVPQRSLKDSRITVLGTGDIGCSFAVRARAFEPQSITGVNRSGGCDKPLFDRILTVERLDEVLPETDLLVMSLPDTPETRGIMSRERLGLLPGDSYIVNVGRGSAIDEDALADSLDKGELAGAALDVFRTEPLPEDCRLWKTKNLLITPHVAGNLTLEHTIDRNVEMFCEDLENFAAGRPLKYMVDRKLGY